MSDSNIAADQLRLLIERIERLEEEKKGIGDDIKDVYLEAKATGYDVPAMRAIVRLRKMDPHVRQEAEAVLATYKSALGIDDLFSGHDGRAQEPERREEPAPADAPVVTDEGERYLQALELVTSHQKASTSWLQRQLRVGYNVAARLIEKMEAAGIVSAPDGRGARTVLVADLCEAIAMARVGEVKAQFDGAVH